MTSLNDRMIAADGRPTAFDYLRVILSCLVIVSHTPVLCYGTAVNDVFNRLPGVHSFEMLILPMFFSLSGFLVAGSMERCKSIFGFLGLRAIRIYPALVVEVVLSAFILGPLFTILPLADYFSDQQFLRYLVNVTGHISFYLPGVFGSNPQPDLVNRQLWTVPYELYCYVVISGVMLFGLARNRRLFMIAFIAGTTLYAAQNAYRHGIPMEFRNHIPGRQLVFAFLAGILVFLFRDRIPFRHGLGLLIGLIAGVCYVLPMGEDLAILPVALFTAYVGCANPRKIGILRGADYSYGVYLYGWPVQQALVATFLWARIWWIHIPVALLLTAAFAALSWHMVEKPALAARTPLKRLEGRWLALFPGFRQRVFGTRSFTG